MATLTLGTNATTSLTAVKFLASLSAADLADVSNGVKNDQINENPIYPGAFTTSGKLYIPNRGVLTVLPGDYVAIDSTTGWPILLSALAIASGPYTHS